LNLSEFFAQIGPLLRGQMDAQSAARRLYPGAPDPEVVARLGIYERLCHQRRLKPIRSVYPRTAAVTEKLIGAGSWHALCDCAFMHFPAVHFERIRNLAFFPAFLAQQGLPAALVELAKAEWALCDVRFARDDPNDAVPEQGTLRLCSTARVVEFSYAFASWARALAEGWPRDPEVHAHALVFWRNARTKAEVRTLGDGELAVCRCLLEGVQPAGPEGRPAIRRLRELGIVLGIDRDNRKEARFHS
jgi:hypothetical protein